MVKILKQVKSIPDTPGIYIFYNTEGNLIYVGKATSLKNRVGSYFRSFPPDLIGMRRASSASRPVEAFIQEVADIKWLTTESVLEAIILEANAIKKYLPKYNVIGKDDKSWNYITISDDEYPVVGTAREREFKIKYGISECRMQNADFDTSSHVRNLKSEIKNLQYVFGPYPGLNTKATMKLLRRMFWFSTCEPNQKRPCFYYQLGQCYGVCTGEITAKEYRHRVIRPLVLFLKGKKKELIKTLEKEMKVFVKKHAYEDAARLRDQIQSLQRIHDIALLNKSFVSDSFQISDFRLQINNGDTGSKSKICNLQSEIRRIEGYDISNLGSTGMVGSMVVFTDGFPDKKEYRKFKIKREGQSDVDCLEEVLRRRLHHPEWPLPDLFLVDGGLPQVNQIKKLFKEQNITTPLLGIAKGPERKRNDIIFANNANTNHDSVNRREFIRWVDEHRVLLIAVRDEAHRFAISYQKKTRRLR